MGAAGVGKSGLTTRLVNDSFLEEYDPTVEDSYRKSAIIDDQKALLNILDTSGCREFSPLQYQWIEHGEGFLLVYCVTSRATFEEVQMLCQKISRWKENKKIPIVICANKCDVQGQNQREVSTEDGEALAAQWRCPFFETSGKYKVNHEACFFECV